MSANGARQAEDVTSNQRKLLRKPEAEGFLPLDSTEVDGDYRFLERDVPDELFSLFRRLIRTAAITQVDSMDSGSHRIGIYALTAEARTFVEEQQEKRTAADANRPDNPCGCPFAKNHDGGDIRCPRCGTRWPSAEYHRLVRQINRRPDRRPAVADGGDRS